MNLETVREKLVHAARRAVPDDAVPPGFAGRVRAAIRALESDPMSVWSTGLWRAALCAMAIAFVAGLFLAPPVPPPSEIADAAETELAESALPDVSDLDPATPW